MDAPTTKYIEIVLKSVFEGKKNIQDMVNELIKVRAGFEATKKAAVVSGSSMKRNSAALRRLNTSYKELKNQSLEANIPMHKLGRIMDSANLGLDKQGRIIDTVTNKKKKHTDVTDRLRIVTQRFRMELLSVMFFGMAVAGAFTSLLQPAMNTFGVFDLWNDLLTVYFLDTAKDLMNNFMIPLFNISMTMPTELKKVTGSFAILGIVLGTSLFLFGQIGLGIEGIMRAVPIVSRAVGVAKTAGLAGAFTTFAISVAPAIVGILTFVATLYVFYELYTRIISPINKAIGVGMEEIGKKSHIASTEIQDNIRNIGIALTKGILPQDVFKEGIENMEARSKLFTEEKMKLADLSGYERWNAMQEGYNKAVRESLGLKEDDIVKTNDIIDLTEEFNNALDKQSEILKPMIDNKDKLNELLGIENDTMKDLESIYLPYIDATTTADIKNAALSGTLEEKIIPSIDNFNTSISVATESFTRMQTAADTWNATMIEPKEIIITEKVTTTTTKKEGGWFSDFISLLNPFDDFIFRAGQAPIAVSPNDNIMGFKGDSPAGGTTVNNYINIDAKIASGVDINELSRKIGDEVIRSVNSQMRR